MESVDTAFLSLPESLVLQTICPTASTVVVWIACTSPVAACPRCQQPSERVHGYYIRTVDDLPCGGRRVLLRFAVRKFVCCTQECSQGSKCSSGVCTAVPRLTCYGCAFSLALECFSPSWGSQHFTLWTASVVPCMAGVLESKLAR